MNKTRESCVDENGRGHAKRVLEQYQIKGIVHVWPVRGGGRAVNKSSFVLSCYELRSE